MGWPLRPDNWRNSAGPAQDAYAAVAEAILEFEPVTVCSPHHDEVRACPCNWRWMPVHAALCMLTKHAWGLPAAAQGCRKAADHCRGAVHQPERLLVPGQWPHSAPQPLCPATSCMHSVACCLPRDCMLACMLALGYPCALQLLELYHSKWWPQFVVRDSADGKRELAGVDWRFNAWGGLKGGLYKDWRDDNLVGGWLQPCSPFMTCRPYPSHALSVPPAAQVAGRILRQENVKRFKCHAVMEGGSFHVDGEGQALSSFFHAADEPAWLLVPALRSRAHALHANHLLCCRTVLTTEECLLNPNRNPQLSKAQIEQVLKDHLGVSKVPSAADARRRPSNFLSLPTASCRMLLRMQLAQGGNRGFAT